jgi:hypothetical protein
VAGYATARACSLWLAGDVRVAAIVEGLVVAPTFDVIVGDFSVAVAADSLTLGEGGGIGVFAVFCGFAASAVLRRLVPL